jgi:hypothetical protein
LMKENGPEMRKCSMRPWLVALIIGVTLVVPFQTQNKHSTEKFEKVVSSSAEPLFIDGERIYRANEVTRRAVVIFKAEPMFTDKARKKKVHGTVLLRAVFKASGEVKILNIVKRLPHGLTEQAIEAAGKMKFEVAILDGKPV